MVSPYSWACLGQLLEVGTCELGIFVQIESQIESAATI